MDNDFQIDSECPFGEGNSSQNICDILIKNNTLTADLNSQILKHHCYLPLFKMIDINYPE